MPKLVIFDVDGTLVDFEGRSYKRSTAVLDRLRAANVPIAIATGRPIAHADFTLNQVGTADWVIGGNGAALLEVANHTFHRATTVPESVASAVVAGLRSSLPGVGFAAETLHEVIEEPGFARRVPPSRHSPPVDDLLGALRGQERDVQRMMVFHDDYDHRLPELAECVEPFVGEHCEIQYGTVLPFVEVASVGGHKAVALQLLVDHLGIDAADVLAFGDGTNDIEMLQWAGTGVAMGSAVSAVQAVADEVTASVEDAGVAIYLEPLLDAAGL